MRIIRKKYRPKKQELIKQHRINLGIVSPKVLLIDDLGVNHGVVDTPRAIEMAREHGLDLVEVSPLSQPPVAKIIDYNKLKYQMEKEMKKTKAKAKRVEIKGLRLSLTIGKNDLNTRAHQANQFLENNDKVRIEIVLKGREQQRKNLAKDIIQQFINQVDQIIPIRVEQEITFQGGRGSAIIAKKS